MFGQFLRFFLDPHPHRTFSFWLINKYRIGSYEQRCRIGAVERPHYGYCLYSSATLAVRLGMKEISALEFGVAGGNGLVNLEYHASEIEKLLPIKIKIFGFDTGSGLPTPIDYRDIPHRFREKSFKMDLQALTARLKRANLVLGDVKDTVISFTTEQNPPPIGSIFFDLDFYSSTMDAFKLFDSDEKYFLPRIFCYFDDILGTEIELYNDFVGERLAIREFNETHLNKKISPAYHLLKRRVQEKWHHRVFIYHHFYHSRYNDFVGEPDAGGLALSAN
jgi:hypothetical protein